MFDEVMVSNVQIFGGKSELKVLNHLGHFLVEGFKASFSGKAIKETGV